MGSTTWEAAGSQAAFHAPAESARHLHQDVRRVVSARSGRRSKAGQSEGRRARQRAVFECFKGESCSAPQQCGARSYGEPGAWGFLSTQLRSNGARESGNPLDILVPNGDNRTGSQVGGTARRASSLSTPLFRVMKPYPAARGSAEEAGCGLCALARRCGVNGWALHRASAARGRPGRHWACASRREGRG